MSPRAKKMWQKHHQKLSLKFYSGIRSFSKDTFDLDGKLSNIERLLRKAFIHV